MRTPEYYGSVEKTRDKVIEILDKSGLAYFISLQPKEAKTKKAYYSTNGKIGDSKYSYELVIKATVVALSKYSEERRIELLKYIGKKLGYELEVKEVTK